MLIGGVFNSIDGVARNNLARVLDAGTVDTSWNANVQANLYLSTASVRSFLAMAGGGT